MPVVRIQPGEWLPDVGPIRSNGLAEVYGVAPIGGMYLAGPMFYENTKSIPAAWATATCYGMHIHEDAATRANAYMYVGTEVDLYRSAVNETVMTDATGAGALSTPSSESGWQFASFGNNILATNGVDEIKIATTPTTNFAKNNQTTVPVSYDPKCKFITTIRNHILIGNISFAAAPNIAAPASALSGTSYPTMVMWSVTDNARRFGDPKGTPGDSTTAMLGADWQDFPDEHGPVTGLCGGEYALIFKKSAIYRMDGPPWTFTKIVSGSGTIYPNSIAKHYDNIYYWGPGGPMVLKGGAGEPINLSSGKCQRALQDSNLYKFWFEANPSIGYQPYMLYSSVDYKNDLIIWSAPYAVSSDDNHSRSGNTTAFLVYSVRDDRFSLVRFRLGGVYGRVWALKSLSNTAEASFDAGLGTGGTPGYVMSNLYGVYTAAPSVGPVPLDINVFQTLATTTVGNPKEDTRSWDNPLFTFPYFTLPIQNEGEQETFNSTSILRVRPVYFHQDNKMMNVTVIVRTCSRFPMQSHSNTYNYTSTGTYQDENGWIDITYPISGTHHQIELEFKEPEDGLTVERYAPNLESFFELEIEYSIDSKHGSAYRS